MLRTRTKRCSCRRSSGNGAPKVTDAVQIQPGQRVLDVACGTGIIARSYFASGAVGYRYFVGFANSLIF